MGNYEIVEWVRSMRMHFRHRAPEFNIETLVQIVNDKELTGAQLQSEEVKVETLFSWFTEWNERQDTIPDHTIQTVIQVIFVYSTKIWRGSQFL